MILLNGRGYGAFLLGRHRDLPFQCNHCSIVFFSSRVRHTVFDCDWSSDVCSPDPASRNATVVAGDTARVAFAGPCPPPPATTGSVGVTTSTTGASPDVDGYSVAVDNGTSQHIDPNNSTGVTFTDLPVGSHTAVLSGVAANCTVTGGNSKTVNVTAGGTTIAALAISRPPPPPPTRGPPGPTTTRGSPPPPPHRRTITAGSGASPTPHSNAANTYRVTLTVTDNGGLTDVLSKDVVVTQPPVFNQPPVVIAGSDQHPLVGLVFNLDGASFSDPDHDGPWTVTIDWGDGSQRLTFSASEGPINGSHSYTGVALTEYTLTVTVVDAHGNRNSDSKKVTVALL